MDMASAFATLANDGIRCKTWAVRKIEYASLAQDAGDFRGGKAAAKADKVLYQHHANCKQVIEPQIAHLVTAMLEKVVCCGTGTAAQIPGREYIFLLDVSGSMHGFPLDTAKTLMRNLLGKLRPTDTFNIVLFSGAAHVRSHAAPRIP